MKKSEVYYLSQFAVVNSPSIAPESKLEILRVLMMDEDLEKFSEEQEERKTFEKLNVEFAVNKTVGVEE